MSSRIEQYNLSQDGVFQGRVAAASIAKAVTIATETSAGLRPPRKELARRVLRDPIGEAKGLSSVVVRDATIAAKSPLTNTDVSDGEIDSALSDAVWNGYAEAFA